MNVPKLNSIIELQNLMSSKNIERIKQEFIEYTIRQAYSTSVSKVDYNQGIIYYFDSFLGKMVEKKFEDYLQEILWKITNDIKAEIDLSNFLFNNKEKLNFWRTILKSFHYIQDNHPNVINTFPISLKPYEEIKLYLEIKYGFRENSQFNVNSYFTLKPKYSSTDLQQIFDFITDELYIDSEIYDFSDFFSVLNDKQTEIKLTFNCSTEIMVCFLFEMSNLFSDLTRKRIAESGRFLSKSATLISESSFNTTINRIKGKSNKDLDKIREFFLQHFSQ